MNIDPAKIRPAGSRVLVKRDAHDTVTSGGLFIPERFQASPGGGSRQELKRGRGVVLAVGPGAWEKHERGHVGNVFTGRRAPMDVAVGDRVMFSRLADGGDLDALGLPDHTLLDASEIIGIVESEDP